MSQAEIINVTALARSFHATTPVIKKRLETLGVMPVQEIEMPSGRKFVLFNKQEAMEVLEKDAKEREQAAMEAKAAAGRPTRVVIDDEAFKALQAEVAAMKEMMEQILGYVTQKTPVPKAKPVVAKPKVEKVTTKQ